MIAEVTIISLIYRSPEYAVGLYKRLLETTPTIASGKTLFYFVANNANTKTLKTLVRENIPHLIFNSEEVEEKVHFDLGFSGPEYIGRVYAGYNFGIQSCKTKKVVLINSDMVFSNNWLEGLLAYEDGKSIVSCTLVERNHPRFGLFPGALEHNFGSSFKNLMWDAWLEFSKSKTSSALEISNGGPYMPSLFLTDWFNEITYFPQGNLRHPSGAYSDVLYTGDEFLFLKFRESGIRHITSPGSYCYHFKEGERSTEFSSKLQSINLFVNKYKHKIKLRFLALRNLS